MATDDDNKGNGVLLPMGVTDNGDLQGFYVDQDGSRPVQVSPPGNPHPEGCGTMNVRHRDGENFYDAEIITDCGSDCGHKGPARVSTPDFRDGWDRIWGPKEPAEA